MFFPLSKIIWAMVSPVTVVLILLLAGVIACVFRRTRGAFILFFSATLLFIVFGVTAAGDDLLSTLENVPAASLPAHIDGILILGGAFDTGLSVNYGSPVMNADTQRVLEGVRLASLYPNAKLVFSGGEGVLHPSGKPEAQDVDLFLKRYGISTPQPMIYEARSRNTLENFERTREMLHPAVGEQWILVTSAFHMKRALTAAKVTGWPTTLLPWPTAWRNDGKIRVLPRHFNIIDNLGHSDIALHEYMGLLTYRILLLRGKA